MNIEVQENIIISWFQFHYIHTKGRLSLSIKFEISLRFFNIDFLIFYLIFAYKFIII